MLQNYRKKIELIETGLLQIIEDILSANKMMYEAENSSDYAKIDSAIEKLSNINQIAHEVDNTVVSTLALFSPEAKDLRELVAILKITNELTRAKSSVKNFGLDIKDAYEEFIFDKSLVDKILLLQECSIQSTEYLGMMIKSTDENITQKLYDSILAQEDKADEIYAIIDKSVIDQICDDSKISVAKVRSLKAIRRLEKITDRCVGVAQLIMYAQTGGEITQ